MVSLPELRTYSAEQIKKSRDLSPAIDRYLKLLENPLYQDPADLLRIERHSQWLRAAMAVLNSPLSPEEICRQWSLSSEVLLQKCWKKNNLENSAVSIVAMGKLGAHELNLSSDVDLFFISEKEVDKDVLKNVRRFLGDLTEVRTTGFCYRVDLDLRPGGSTHPLILSFDQMTNHYGYHGETWERVSMIRQNVISGPQTLKNDILTFCKKFAFRKHIDYGLFSDLYSLRTKIQAHKSNSQGINLKFSPGGIRDLELLVHSLQLIHGGKNPSLQTSSTTLAIKELAKLNILNPADANLLQDCYWQYRHLENKTQLHEDQHTYELKKSSLIEERELQEFLQRSQKIQTILDQFLEPHHTAQQLVSSEFLLTSFESLQIKDEGARKNWQDLLAQQTVSREKERDESQRKEFLKNVLEELKNNSSDPAMAIQHLQQFIAASRAKASLFALFNKHPELTSQLVAIFSCSPYLSQILILRPELVDSFLLQHSQIDTVDEESFFKSLQDYKLLSDLIHSSQFLRDLDVQKLTSGLSLTTDKIIKELISFLRHKLPTQINLLALGKWSSQSMGLTSDLDFVFLAESSPTETDIKFARRFINFLSSSNRGHRLYNIDLRLRPSGNAGPLMMSLEELKKYLCERSEIWERQAYLFFRQLFEPDTQPLFTARPLTEEETTALFKIQSQLLKKAGTEIDLKKSYGGLLHTELRLQMALLYQQKFPQTPNLQGAIAALKTSATTPSFELIFANYQKLRTYQQLHILISEQTDAIFKEDSPTFVKLSALSKNKPKVLFQDLLNLLQQQELLLNKLDPLPPPLKIES